MTTYSHQKLSSVYGPVQSWRLGVSLGIDLLCVDSICSFRCIYCQLGKIHDVRKDRAVFVPTEKVLADLQVTNWQAADVLTISGSGEPTLASNLGAVIKALQSFTRKPVIVLTNATLLMDAQVRRELSLADKIFCKLDAVTDHTLQLIDRPVAGVEITSILTGLQLLRQEYRGFMAIQTMVLPVSKKEIHQLGEYLKILQPDEVQLNLPSRPVPHEWALEMRGNHSRSDENATRLKMLDPRDLNVLVEALQVQTGLKIIAHGLQR